MTSSRHPEEPEEDPGTDPRRDPREHSGQESASGERSGADRAAPAPGSGSSADVEGGTEDPAAGADGSAGTDESKGADGRAGTGERAGDGVGDDAGDARAGQPDPAEAIPPWERVDEQDRIDDAAWQELVSEINADRGFVPEMSADEVREALEESEMWEPEDPGPIGWRTASPLFMLGILGLLGGIAALFVAAFVLRGLSGYALLIIIAVILLSTGILIRQLPRHRNPDDGDGAQV